MWEKYCRTWKTTGDNTNPEYLIRIAIRRQQLLRECYSMLRVRYIACLVTTRISNVQYVSTNEELISCQHCFGFLRCLTRESDKRSFLISNMCAGNKTVCQRQYFAHKLRVDLACYKLCRLVLSLWLLVSASFPWPIHVSSDCRTVFIY